MIKRTFKALWSSLVLCCGCICYPVFGYVPDLKQPVQVQSDTAEYDTQTGIAKHLGSVLMTQGQRQLQSDELIVQRNHRGDITLCIARGKPALYKGIWENGQPMIEGKAEEIRFDPVQGLLVLEGQAELFQDNYRFKGPNITYDLHDKKIKSGINHPERTVIIIHPKHNE